MEKKACYHSQSAHNYTTTNLAHIQPQPAMYTQVPLRSAPKYA